MNRKIFSLPTVLFWALVISGFSFSCKNKSSDNKVESFQPASQNSSTEETINGNNVNFVPAAKAVTPGVVHVKTLYENNAGNMYRPEGERQPVSAGSGSGVVISSDGYIATNNHVVENATQIEVVFTDRRAFKARLIGRDPNTDLALLKVDAKNLPIVEFGNSDNVKVGEWVLAVGYPFSLNTTVTAGIISAKGRSIGIINSNSPTSSQANTAIESFIQTDAAINPGNSGGALVDMNAKLIGINTAIASLTGSYAGYAFAIPVNLAKKILDDLKQFGAVKRGILGVSFPAPAAEDQYLEQHGIKPGMVNGVFITGIQQGSAADAAGLKEGDIIQSIDGIELFSSAEFSERIARHHPGDKVELTYLRNGKPNTTTAALRDEEKKLLPSESQPLSELYKRLGADFAPLTAALKERYNINAGMVVSEIRPGGFFQQLGIPRGTIIAYINGRTIENTADINEALIAAQNTRVQILAIAPDGSKIAFEFSFGA